MRTKRIPMGPLVPKLAADFVCHRFWDFDDHDLITEAIVRAKPANVFQAIVAGLGYIRGPRSPLSRRPSAADELQPVLNELSPETRAFLHGGLRLPLAEVHKHRQRIRRFLAGSTPKAKQ